MVLLCVLVSLHGWGARAAGAVAQDWALAPLKWPALAAPLPCTPESTRRNDRCFGSRFFKPGEIPALGDCLEQMVVSFRAMPLYSLLPVATEYCVEQGWTMAYTRCGSSGSGSGSGPWTARPTSKGGRCWRRRPGSRAAEAVSWAGSCRVR